MYRFVGLAALCLLLSGCYYPYPYGDGYGYGQGYGYGYDYRYAPRYRAPPASLYPAPAYPYGGPAQPYGSPNGYPQTLGPTGDTPGATGNQ